ncbi:MAG: SGNH/GDSL hydrolase family protein [Candidatus Dadabacteria bacterium]
MKEAEANNRRSFIKKAGLLAVSTAISSQWLQAAPLATEEVMKEGEATTFLFQGDSITDGGRSRNKDWNHVLGHGYAYLVSSRLWADHPKQGFHFFNRGISGNKITDLAARWETDTIELKPDVLSILIGINDTATFLNGKKEFSVEQFETGYKSLLQQSINALPQVQLVLCEPFILPVGKVKERWNDYFPEVQKRQQIVSKLSREFNTVHIEFQKVFNNALSKAPADYWIWDGIHPMPAGHELMAREWIYQVSRKLKFIR